MIFWQKAANYTPQIDLWREKNDTLAYDLAITTLAGARIVVRQSCLSSVHRRSTVTILDFRTADLRFFTKKSQL